MPGIVRFHEVERKRKLRQVAALQIEFVVPKRIFAAGEPPMRMDDVMPDPRKFPITAHP